MIYNLDSQNYLARHPVWALSWGDRLRGMIGRRFDAERMDAMVFPKCAAVHSMGMTFPLDLVFVDADSMVVGLKVKFRPWRWPVFCSKAATVIELPAGAIGESGTKIGHRLNLNSTLSSEMVEKLQKDAIVNAGILPREAEMNGEKE